METTTTQNSSAETNPVETGAIGMETTQVGAMEGGATETGSAEEIPVEAVPERVIYRERDWYQDRPWIDEPDADIDAYLAGLEEDPGFDLRDALERWRRDGVIVFENVVDTRLIDALERDIDYLRRHYLDFDLLVETSGVQKHLHDLTDAELNSPGLKFNSIHTISRAAAHLSVTRHVAQFLRHVFGDAPCAMQSLTFYKGSQQPIHVDYPYVRCQTPVSHLAASWIPLEDIHPDSGPLAYYPGSHRTEVSEFFDWGDGSILLESDSARAPIELSDYLAERMRAKGIEKRVFCPRKGDALVWHGNLSHEGTAIRDMALTRKSYVTHYSSYRAYPKAHLKPTAPDGGLICRENGGCVYEYSWLNDQNQLPSIELFGA